MASNPKKSDINRRILETRKETEELKKQLQNLVDCESNFLPARKDKENVNASQNRGAIKKSYDAKPGTSKATSNTKQGGKKARNTTSRIDSLKPQEIGLQINAHLQKQRLLELHKKSLEIVAKNVQAKRERSKSRDGTVPTRPVRYRSLSQENSVNNSRSRATKDSSKREELDEREQRNPNLLYPPLPDYMARRQASSSKTSKTEDVTRTPNKESSILNKSSVEKVGNVSKRKSKSHIDANQKLLKPVNLFNSSLTKSEKSVCNVSLRSSNQDNLAVKKLVEESEKRTDEVQREKIIQADPYSFINSVKSKLQHAVNIPTPSCSVLKEISQPNTPEKMKTKQEIFQILQRSTKSSKKSNKSFALHNDGNSDPMAGESDMSRNTSRNRASLRKTESVKQSYSPGIKIISNITLVPHRVEIKMAESEDVQHNLEVQPTSHKSQPRKPRDVSDAKNTSSRNNLMVESPCVADLSFESDLSRSRESIITFNSPIYNKVIIRSPNANLEDNLPETANDVKMITKSESQLRREMQNINSRRGTDKSSSVWRLSEPTVSQNLAEPEAKGKVEKNITLRFDRNQIPEDSHDTNEIHLKFIAEIHRLNEFNESLLQLSAEEKAGESLESKNGNGAILNKVSQNQYTQTSLESNYVKGNIHSGANSELSSINYSRGSFIDVDVSSLDLNNTLSKLENKLPGLEISELNASTSSVVRSTSDLSNIENLHSKNFAGMSLRMFEQLIKDEDVRLENLKTILKIREQALLDRARGELAWLEIQRKHLGETDQMQKASLIKKKQRAVLVNLQKEKHEMQRLKQMQKAASLERKIILKEQRSLIKHQLYSDNMLAKIRVHAPRERRLSGPLKVIQSHSDSKSKTSISLKSSTDKDQEFYNVTSHTHSVVSTVSEVSGEGVRSRDVHSDVVALNLASRSERCVMPISQMKQTLLVREAALQKRSKAAEDLLQWHKKLLEEEKRITELESAASAIISNALTSIDVGNKYNIKGKYLNRLWLNLTGCEEEKFVGDQTYPMSQVELKRFHQSAMAHSKTKGINIGGTEEGICKHISDELGNISEVPPTAPLEPTPEIVSEDIDIVDQNLNRLIDDFIKVKEDISSLSVKARQNQDSDRSEKPAFAEANRPSKEQEGVSKDNISMCNTTASAVAEVKDSLGKSKGEVASEESFLSKSKELYVSVDKITPSKTKEDVLDQAQVERNSEMSEMNFNKSSSEAKKKSKENDTSTRSERILLELSTAEDRINAEVNKQDLQVDNLIKTGKVLDRLSQLQDDISTSVQESSKVGQNLVSSKKEDSVVKQKDVLQMLTQSEHRISTAVASTDISTQKSVVLKENEMYCKGKDSVGRSEEAPQAETGIVNSFPGKRSAPQVVVNLYPFEKITEGILAKLDEGKIEHPSDTPGLSTLLPNRLHTLKEYEPMLDTVAIEENEIQFLIDKAKDNLQRSGQGSTISIVDEKAIKDLSHLAEKKVGFQSSEELSLKSLEETDGKVDINENIERRAGQCPTAELIVVEREEAAAEIIEIYNDNEPHEVDKESEIHSKFINNSEDSVMSHREATLDIEDQSYRSGTNSSISEAKLPRNAAEHVKTRVSEILAHSRQPSWENKIPRVQDLYTTTYDVVASVNYEELGTPIKEGQLFAAKSIFGSEAENILRKQLAIEREIKEITQQQAACLFVREIPNKPPPPYVPPLSSQPLNVITIMPTKYEVEEISKYSAEILHKAYLSHNLDNISISENTLGLISKNITKECYKFVFDLCKEISKEHYKQFEKEKCPSWLQVTKKPQLTVVKPLDVVGLEKHLTKNLKELFGYEKPVRRENAIIKWSRKNRDHVDEILVMESQVEEAQWTNYDKDELLVMNEATNEIMNMLLKETGQVLSKILSKRTYLY